MTLPPMSRWRDPWAPKPKALCRWEQEEHVWERPANWPWRMGCEESGRALFGDLDYKSLRYPYCPYCGGEILPYPTLAEQHN